jgi:peptidoglycan/LPS O-acetylase OafA/YrhL
MAKGEIRSLTGLRGVAALVVMAYHYRNLGITASRPAFGPGYLMVDLFFVLSGFVMARTYGAAFRTGFSGRAYLRFLDARLARVYPLYALIVLGMFGLAGLVPIAHPAHAWRALLINLLLVQNLGAGLACRTCSEAWLPPAWSISTEAAAYLVFPVLAVLALFRSRACAAGVLAVSVGALVLLSRVPAGWLHGHPKVGVLEFSGGETLWPVVRCLAGFCLGLLTWRLVRSRSVPEQAFGTAAALLLVLGLAMCWRVRDSDLAMVALFPLLILHVSPGRSMLARALASAAPHRLGEWSYAIYLLHWPVLNLMPVVFPYFQAAHIRHGWSLALALMAVATILLAALAHRHIERPARRLLRGLFDDRRLPMALEPSAP